MEPKYNVKEIPMLFSRFVEVIAGEELYTYQKYILDGLYDDYKRKNIIKR